MNTRKYQYKQFAATRIYTAAIDYSPDGNLIAHSVNTSGQFNLWSVPSGGGFAKQLTMFTDHTVRAVKWGPDGHIYFTADHNTNEQHQIYRIPQDGGWPEALTDAPDAQHNLQGNAFSPDESKIVYAANDIDQANMDVIIRDLQTGDTTRPMKEGALYFPVSWSPNGEHLLVVQFHSNTDQDILFVDVASGDITNATPHEGDTIYLPGAWAPDGSGFYMMTNVGREFTNMAFYTLADGTWEWVETPDHDIENMDISKDGSKLIWSINVNGASKFRGKDLMTGEPLNLPDLQLGVMDNFTLSPDGNRVAMIFTTPNEAANLYEFDLTTGELTALGQSMLGGISVEDMIEPETITFPSFDGRDIPAWLFKPKVGHGPYPVVLSIHGGPESQERPRYMYNGMYQYLLNRGFGILAPNIRGSTGYGITYQSLIHRDWGGDELKDIEHAAKYLMGLDWVDSNRIAVFGGSFGGFATLSAVTRLPDLWAVGVDIVGPSNLITFVESVPPFWKRFMKKWIGDADEDRDMLIERSPITYVDNVKVPMLVIQGANDPRVVQAESDQMVEKLRANGNEVEYYVDPEEGHGATRRENYTKWITMVTEFLENHLLDEPMME